MAIVEAEVTSDPVEDNATEAIGIDDAISAAVAASEDPPVTDDDGEASESTEGVDETAGEDVSSEDGADDSEANEDGEDGEEGESTSEAVDPMQHWDDDTKASFATLDQKGQQAFLSMAKNLEGGFTRKSQKLSDDTKFSEGVRGLIDEATKAELLQRGSDEVGYFQYLNGLQQFAAQDPVGYVKWAMQNLNVDAEKLGLPQKPQVAEAEGTSELDELLADPAVKQLKAELAEVQGKLQQRDQFEQQQQQQAHAAQVQTLQTTISTFRSELDDNGQLRYPHFDTVKETMGHLMNADSSLTSLPDGPEKMQAAYDQAVWSNPALRQQFIDAESSKKAQEVSKAKDAARAKKAVGVKPAAGVVSVRDKPGTLEESIEAAFAKHGL